MHNNDDIFSRESIREAFSQLGEQVHLTAEISLLYASGGLCEDSRSQVASHTKRCKECNELLSLAKQFIEEKKPETTDVETGPVPQFSEKLKHKMELVAILQSNRSALIDEITRFWKPLRNYSSYRLRNGVEIECKPETEGELKLPTESKRSLLRDKIIDFVDAVSDLLVEQCEATEDIEYKLSECVDHAMIMLDATKTTERVVDCIKKVFSDNLLVLERTKRPIFYAHEIKKRQQSGLLLQRRFDAYGSPDLAYFYSEEPDGLQPTEEILEICPAAYCHALQLSNSYEKSIVTELMAYAEATERTGKIYASKPFAQSHSNQDFLSTVDRFFDQISSPLRDFLGNSQRFTHGLLRQIPGKPELIGRAQRIGVLTPEHIRKATDFQYLQEVTSVLRIGKAGTPRWFRRGGPMEVDFEHNKVFRRKQTLQKLHDLVVSTTASMLEGCAASGKTVLVCNLAYDLYKEGQTNVFFFTGEDYVPTILAREINHVKGLVVVEDVHLNPNEFRELCLLLDLNPDRRVLFTARHLQRLGELSIGADAEKIPSLRLAPFTQAEEIIRIFAEDHCDPSLTWSAEVFERIKAISGENLWLLAWTLEGYVNSRGKGHPKSWLGSGVKAHLQRLEALDTAFPELLIVLSRLYQNEVLTAESYLVDNIGFDSSVLDMMVGRGEITCKQMSSGYFFYGLHHSALAEVYWEHGQEYRKRRRIPEYENFVYDYLSSDTPNGLELLARLGEDIRDQLMARLDAEDRLVRVIESEQNLWPSSWPKIAVDAGLVTKLDTLESLTRKLKQWNNVWEVIRNIGEFARYDIGCGRELLNCLGRKWIATRLRRLENIRHIDECISKVTEVHPDIAKQICDLMNVEELAGRINQAESPSTIGDCISTVFKANEQVGCKLFELCKMSLAARASQDKDLCRVTECIEGIHDVNPDMARQICDLMNVEELAGRINQAESPSTIGDCISTVLKANEHVGCKLFELCKMSLAARVSQDKYFWRGAKCIARLHDVNPDTARKLCDLLNVQELVGSIDRAEDPSVIGRILCSILRTNEQIGHNLWEMCKESLARRISQDEHVWRVGECLESFHDANPDLARQLCDLLDVQKLVGSINRAEDPYRIGKVLCRILRTNEQVGRNLFEVCKDSFAAKVSLYRNGVRIAWCIKGIRQISPDIARQLCDLLNVEELVRSISQSGCSWQIEECIAGVLLANEQVGRKLWGLCNERLERNILDEAWCFMSVGYSSPYMARQLCDLLDVEELAQIINQSKDPWEIGIPICRILGVNEQVGHNLWERCKESLAAGVSQDKSLLEGAWRVARLRRVNPDMARQLCDLLNFKEIAENINAAGDTWKIREFLGEILRTNEQVGRKLCGLCKESLIARISQGKDILCEAQFIRSIYSSSPDSARELCEVIDSEEMAMELKRHTRKYQQNFLGVIEMANHQMYQKLLKLLGR